MKHELISSVNGIAISFVITFALSAFSPPAHAQGGVPLWTNCYNGPANADDYAVAVAVDGSGNVFVTGLSDGGSGSYCDYATIKYSSAGVPLWTNRYNGPANGSDRATALAVNGNGNVFVTGSSWATRDGNEDYATVAYSNAGVPLWSKRYNGPVNNEDRAQAVAVDGGGNVIVTGQSIGPGLNYDYATIKYSSAGVPLWTNLYDGRAGFGDYARAVATDSNGKVFVTGYSENSSANPRNYDYATVAYSPAGVLLWANYYNGPGNGDDQPYALAVDSSGNVFVTGASTSTNGYTDYATIKYSGGGVPLWTNFYNGPANSADYAYAMAVDSRGNVFVTGGSYDFATVAYSGTGEPLWTNRYNGAWNGIDWATAVAVDTGGNVFVTGYSAGTNSGFYDYATVAYSNAGVPLWTNRYHSPTDGQDYANAIAVDASGSVFVTGQSWNGSSCPGRRTALDELLQRPCQTKGSNHNFSY